jgi:hypothetical protein
MGRVKKDRFAKALLKPINTAAIVLLGLYTVTWGFWLANPFWDTFSRAPLFDSMRETGVPEWCWGVFAILCGCVTMYGAYKRAYRPLVIGASTAGWHWFMIAIFYFMGDWQNTGGITSLTFSIYAAFIYLNVKVNHVKGRRDIPEIVH